MDVYLCHTVLSVPCSLVVICLERTDLLALLCVMFLVFLSFHLSVDESLVTPLRLYGLRYFDYILLNKSLARILIRCPISNEHEPFYLM